MGLFKPAWQNENPDVREKAISELTDPDTLAYIAENDPSAYVRRVAFVKLACRASTATVEKVTNQKTLADIAKEADDVNVRKAAIEKITDQDILIDIAKNHRDAPNADSYKDKSLRHHIIDNKLTDENALADIARNGNVTYVREAAVSKLTDQSKLVDFAKNSNDDFVRRAAAKKLTDQFVIAYVAKNDRYEYTRRAAVERLTDQSVLADIAQSDEVRHVRLAALGRLTDQNILIGIAKNEDNDNELREAAAGKLTNKFELDSICHSLGHNSPLHKWTDIGGCRKKCSICGRMAYNHDYKQTKYDGSGADVSVSYETCSKCGHSGYASGYGSSLEEGYVKE
jgi:hypothetical protein